MAARSGRLDPADLRVSDAALIEKLKLTEGTYLKRAALLLFHHDPERFVTGSFVKIGYFRSPTDLAYHDEVHGDLFEQSAKTIDLVRTKYLKAAISYQGIQRIERYPVPHEALREAILNALVHRDYAVGAPVQIRVYENRLKIWNPAVLPEGWTLENLLADHSSSPYNPDVANAFFRAGEIETWGRGIQRIFEACENAGTPAPIIDYKPNDLWLEFPFAPEYLKAIATTDPVTAPVTAPVTGTSRRLRWKIAWPSRATGAAWKRGCPSCLFPKKSPPTAGNLPCPGTGIRSYRIHHPRKTQQPPPKIPPHRNWPRLARPPPTIFLILLPPSLHPAPLPVILHTSTFILSPHVPLLPSLAPLSGFPLLHVAGGVGEMAICRRPV